MTRTALALAILALLPAIPMAAHAQPPGEPPPQSAGQGYGPGQGYEPGQGYGHGRGGGGGPMTLAQFQARARDRVMRADTDHDGRISLAEWTAAMAERPGGGRGDPARLFEHMDLNHDGYITPDEIDAVSARRFARMDLNHDGVVTPEERAAMHGGRGGDEGPVEPLNPPQ